MPHWGIRVKASMWLTLKQKNGKFSIGRHTSLYEIGIALATYLRGHTNDTWSPFWLLRFHECREQGVYNNDSMLGAGNVRKSLQVGVLHVCVLEWGCWRSYMEYPSLNAFRGRSPMPFSMSPRAMNHHYDAYIFTWAPRRLFH